MSGEMRDKTAVSTSDNDRPAKTVTLDEILALGTPVGTFGGSTDILLRIRNGKPVAANVGAQGGGQN
jgi:hypothetical protein